MPHKVSAQCYFRLLTWNFPALTELLPGLPNACFKRRRQVNPIDLQVGPRSSIDATSCQVEKR